MEYELLSQMPKAELHVHIEGTLEPEMIFMLAKRNGVRLPYPDADALKKAYAFQNLQDFLDLYYAGVSILMREQDFYDIMQAYLNRAAKEHVICSEIFFDPQAHMSRGVSFETIISGLSRAVSDAKRRLGIDASLIMCFLRHLNERDAFETLEQALPFRDHFIGVGLDSTEIGHPPDKFVRVFRRCRKLGFHLVAHAGEEGPAGYVQAALDLLKVERIDHGVRCMEDPSLVSRLAREQIPLTVCPLSNIMLGVFKSLSEHNLKRMLEMGLMVTINSDDPAYFGGYINQNWVKTARSLSLTHREIYRIAQNGFKASFAGSSARSRHMDQLDAYIEGSVFL